MTSLIIDLSEVCDVVLLNNNNYYYKYTSCLGAFDDLYIYGHFSTLNKVIKQ